MILGAEIALALYGLYALFTGSYNIGRNRKVIGSKARVLGFIALTPLPIAFISGFFLGLILALMGNTNPNPWIYTGLEALIVIGVIIVLSILGKSFFEQQLTAQQEDPPSFNP